MYEAFVKSLAQLTDRRTRGVLWQCVGLALVLYMSVVGLVWWGLSLLAETSWDGVNKLIAALGGVLALIGGGLIYPALVTVLVGLFAEPLCRRVETLYYPGRGPGRAQPIGEIIGGTVAFALKTLGLNLLTLLSTFFLPGINIFVFVAINGYLVSVEYFEMVAVRRMTLKQADSLRKQHFIRLWGAGALFASGMAVPFLGVVAPVVAVIFMVHMLESLRDSTAHGEIALR